MIPTLSGSQIPQRLLLVEYPPPPPNPGLATQCFIPEYVGTRPIYLPMFQIKLLVAL